MGQALIEGILHSGIVPPSGIWASCKSEASCKSVSKKFGIPTLQDPKPELATTDCLIISVKPKQVSEILRGLPISPKTLVISIAAGVPLHELQAALPDHTPVIRAMTNTACLVSEGMTAIAKGQSATAEHLKFTQQIFSAVGDCLELEESLFDAMTGLGGSGPAYLFLIMEALADGGVRVGLPRQIATRIVAQTVLGSAVMLQKLGRHPAEMKDDVTTPAGCTIGALLLMEDGKIRSVLARAVEEAARIAGGLGAHPSQASPRKPSSK